ncbi:MAG TPA: 50S ribosomal protein L5 [Verrucomicrobiae bacterium]|jgi:large subunit ribosomal protein L5|nr:50S ribosomal protein L5 [Verrucomicrobiae bacterium]
MTDKTQPRLQQKYRDQIVDSMMSEFGYNNVMQVPKLKKVVINMGVKEGASDVKVIEHVAEELSRIAGQKPIMIKSKKAISAFKLREGVPIGLKVTLRRQRMFEFIDRLFNIAMPRIRDFRGYSDKSFDDSGNYSLGIQEQMIFPEIEFDKIKKVQGMDVTFVTSAKTKKEGRKLLELLGLPFAKS